MKSHDARQESAFDGWSGPSDDLDASGPESGVEAIERKGWLSRLFGAGRGILLAARGDPEPRALLDAALTLERDGGAVFADLEGWPRPPLINGFVPDLYAVFEDREVVLSFVNERSSLSDVVRRKDLAFSSWAEAQPRRVYEQILVAGGRGGRG